MHLNEIIKRKSILFCKKLKHNRFFDNQKHLIKLQFQKDSIKWWSYNSFEEDKNSCHVCISAVFPNYETQTVFFSFLLKQVHCNLNETEDDKSVRCFVLSFCGSHIYQLYLTLYRIET